MVSEITLSEDMKALAIKYGADALYYEAEAVEEYGEWTKLELMGYNDDELRAMARYAESHGK